MSAPVEQTAQLEAALAALEAQRSVLGGAAGGSVRAG
jgi:hypothetical protein